MHDIPLPSNLTADLQHIGTLIAERIQARPIVARIAGPHILVPPDQHTHAGLVLLAAQLGEYTLNNTLHAAAAIELIQVATLLHNQLVDPLGRRLGTTPADETWEGNVSLMVGDYLLALAASEMAQAPDPRIIIYFSQSVMAICEGELAPVPATPLAEAREQYLFAIGSKHASLFEAACKAGMICGGAALPEVDALGRYGYNLGLALRIGDDLLDYAGGSAHSLRAGSITLPLIYAAAAGSAELAAIADLRDPEAAQIDWATGEVRRLGLARTKADVEHYAVLALQQLEIFPASPARDALAGLAAFARERVQS